MDVDDQSKSSLQDYKIWIQWDICNIDYPISIWECIHLGMEVDL